jgi:hypothetical protein
MTRIVAVLDSMWGGQGRAPRYFRISDQNFSGKRLYRMVGESGFLIVTNACPEYGATANCHGTPDPAWLRDNLDLLKPFALLLVCGRVAQKTYAETGCAYPNVIELPHPAARTWTHKALDEMTARIAKAVST